MSRGSANGDVVGLLGLAIVLVKAAVISIIIGLPLLLIIGGPILYFVMKSKEEDKKDE